MRYRPDRLARVRGDPRPATWTFAGTKVSGLEFPFVVTDGNFKSRNRWEFVVRVPKAAGGRIEVRPTQVPNDKAWAVLDRYGLTFMPATKPGFTRFRYCLLSFPRTDGGGTRRVMHHGDEARLPYWIRELGRRRRPCARGTHATRRLRGDDRAVHGDQGLVPEIGKGRHVVVGPRAARFHPTGDRACRLHPAGKRVARGVCPDRSPNDHPAIIPCIVE
jgi:hypothetical protein